MEDLRDHNRKILEHALATAPDLNGPLYRVAPCKAPEPLFRFRGTREWLETVLPKVAQAIKVMGAQAAALLLSSCASDPVPDFTRSGDVVSFQEPGSYKTKVVTDGNV